MNKYLTKSFKKIFLGSLLSFAVLQVHAQLATFPLKSGGGSVTPNGASLPSGTNANIKTDTAVVGSEITNTPNGTFNSTGIRIKPNSLAWPTAPNDNFSLTVSVSPKVGFDYVLTSVTFKDSAHDNSPNFYCQLAYQANNSGNWVFIGTPQICTNLFGTTTIGGLNEGFYSGNTYKFRFYFYGNGANDKNQGFRMIRLIFNGNIVTPPSINPIVVTGTLGTATKYNNTVTASTYTISNGGTNVKVVNKSGVVYGTNATPTFTNATATTNAATNGVSTASFNSAVTGLTPNTTYYVRAYAITQTDTIYGNTLNFTTDNYSLPSLNTNAPSNVLSNKATTGGNSIDSGGYPVLEKGVCYALNNNPVYSGTKTSDGLFPTNFTTTIKNLTPATKYYIRAYARNQLGVGYGNLDSLTTAAPVPVISAVPGNLDFGDITYNSTPLSILSYKLNANYLTPTTGSITLTAPANYTICATYNGTYASSIPITYSGGIITNKIIYVKAPNAPYGIINGMVLHSGGGVVAPNADTVFMIGNVVQNQDTLTNKGTDFWCGFGYQESMRRKSTDASMAKMSIYVSATDGDANVVVEAPGTGFTTQTFLVANNTVKEFTNFPTGDDVTAGGTQGLNSTNQPDTRLYATGISNKAIHIYTTNGKPVSAWLHTYVNNNSAAGSMLFPSNTWNSSYTVQSYGGKANNSYTANSYFFVIANEDSTDVTFTPSNPILDSTSATLFTINNNVAANFKYQKGNSYTVRLNKGQVFNAMGAIDGDTDPSKAGLGGLDLSGTKVVTTCNKKIAVFSGNGRVLVSTKTCNLVDGSDHLIQQMFPISAWGTKYLTVPTKTMEYNVYRINVLDPTTKVWFNNPTHTTQLTGLINNQYYEVETNRPALIESDKPINVTQFIVAGSCPPGGSNSGNGGGGDPEMIILSPTQQAISNATVYSAPFKSSNATPTGGASFINVLVKKQGIASFKLDNKRNNIDTGALSTLTGNAVFAAAPSLISMDSAFRRHPQDTNYYYARFRVTTSASHKIESNSPFNAIAYGISTGNSSGESYGYNAGTAINNLSAVKFALNPYGSDTSTGSVKTCRNNLVTLQIAIPYDTSTINSIVWDAGSDATRYTPTGPQAGTINTNTGKPLCLGTIVKDGRTFYIYKSPVQYQFFEEGAFKVKVTINGTFVSDCGGTDVQYVNVIVGHDDISFTATPAGCGSTKVTIADATTPLAGTSIIKWLWNFGDNTKDSASAGDSWAPNPKNNPHTYPANNAYTIKLTTINSAGCFSYDSVSIDLAFGISSSFQIAQDTICPGSNAFFAPNSSANAAKWFWDFGDGSAIDSSNTVGNVVIHNYTQADTFYVVQHWVKTAAGCPSAMVKDTIYITHKPIASFIPPSGVCLPGTTLFINTSDTAKGLSSGSMPYTYLWNFGVPSLTDDTSNLKNPSYNYPNIPPPAGGYIVQLTATSKFGCVSNPFIQSITDVYPKPTIGIALTSDKKVCINQLANFDDNSTTLGQTITGYYWDFGDNSNSTVATNGIAYSYFPPAKLYTVKHVVTTDKGCVSDTAFWTIKVNPLPTVGTIMPSSCISGGALQFLDKSTVPVDDSVQTPYNYTWTFGDGPTVYTNKDETHTYATTGTYYITHTISTVHGCSDTKIDTFEIAGSKPSPYYYVPDNVGAIIAGTKNYCNNQKITLIDSSTIALGSIKKVEIYWDTSTLRYPGYTLYSTPTVDLTPQNGQAPVTPKVYTFQYPYSQFSKNPVIKIITYTNDNCYSVSYVDNFTVYATPKVKFDTLRGVCVNGSPQRISFARDSTGRFDSNPLLLFGGKPTYSGNGVVKDSIYPSVAGAGTHLVKVVYETSTPFNNHCRDSAYAPITIWALPTVDFTTSTPLCVNSTVSFTNISTVGAGSGGIKSMLWNFGDPLSVPNDTSSKANPTHSYNTYNTFAVTLKVTSDSGCSNTLTPPKTITINPKPVVGFIMPAGNCGGSPVGFTDTSKIADGSEAQFTHYWDFGDNTNASGTPLPNASHLYTTTPTNPIKLVVTSKDGCKDSLSAALGSVVFPKQHPTFSFNGKTYYPNDTIRACVGSSINFSNKNFPAANQAYWIFGDTALLVNAGKNITHTYPAATVYKGSHYADDNNGCRTDTATFNVLIWNLPTPIIGVSSPTCEKGSITFTDNSTTATGTGNVLSREWNFGDAPGIQATAQIATHSYAAAGNYNVTLKVTTDSGCAATIATPRVVTINPKPAAAFNIPTSLCLPNAVAGFKDVSTIADGSQAQFTHSWNFGHPASGLANTQAGSPLDTITHIYDSSKPYTIRLIVSSNKGCFDTAFRTLQASAIHVQPIADYTVSTVDKDTPRICIGTPITFKDASGANVNTSYWIWGDDGVNAEIGKNPPPHYQTNITGTYYGSHYIKDNYGCTSNPVGFVVIIDSFPVVVGGEKFIFDGYSEILRPYISGAESVLWTLQYPSVSTTDYLDDNTSETPTCYPLVDSIVYKITATTSAGCNAPAAYYKVIRFRITELPNAFSPNGDGKNDYWELPGLKYLPGVSVQVWDRYGRQVLNKLGYNTPWDGNDQNTKQPLPVGVYYYIIKPGLNLPTISGSVTILR